MKINNVKLNRSEGTWEENKHERRSANDSMLYGFAVRRDILAMVADTCHPNTWEAQERDYKFRPARECSHTLSQKKVKR